MKNSIRLLAVAFACAIPLSAQAADYIEPAYDWSGFYLGVQGGYGFGEAEHNFFRGAPAPGDPAQQDSKPEGLFGGLHAGYNFQADKVLFGIEADAELADIHGSYNDAIAPGSAGESDINAQGSIRARLGLPMDRLLPYVTGGLAIADADFVGGPPGNFCCGYSKTPTGYTIGAGLEYAITDTLTTRIEYRFTDFGKQSGNLDPVFVGVTMPVDLETHAIRVGLSWQF